MKNLKFNVDPCAHHQQAKLQANEHNIAETKLLFRFGIFRSPFSFEGEKARKTYQFMARVKILI